MLVAVLYDLYSTYNGALVEQILLEEIYYETLTTHHVDVPSDSVPYALHQLLLSGILRKINLLSLCASCA